MKKRLLITSIVMMLVVAVALSTATYAWFTSNVQVTANTITMTAGTSNSSALGIQWTKAPSAGATFNAHYTTDINSVSPAAYITFLNQEGGFQPAAPLLLDTISTHAAPTFYTAYVNAQGEFQADGEATDVYRFANYVDETAAAAVQPDGDTYSNLIHVANLAQSGPQTLYLTATITGTVVATTAGEEVVSGYTYYNSNKVALDPQPAVESTLAAAGYKVQNSTDASALVRVAVYEVSGANYTYKGLLGKTAGTNNTAHGQITGGQAASGRLTASTTTELKLGTIEAQEDKAYAVYVWLDGAAFDEAQSLKTAEIALNFSTAKTSNGTVTEINAPQA